MDQKEDEQQLKEWRDRLLLEYRDLDVAIKHLTESRHHDSMRIQRLTHRKLKLKDTIHKIESELIPDLDA